MVPTILEVIATADKLPSLPSVAIEVLRLTKKADASVDELAKVIQNDPALTAKVLRVVNSPLFGVTRKIASIKEAISLLGMRSVKVMALSFSVVGIVGNGGSEFDLELYWRRSLTTAVGARLIAKAVAARLADAAFVAGLLTDIGMVAAWRCAPDLYRPVVRARQRKKQPLVDLETTQFGMTHARMSQSLLQAWGLPEAICDAIGSHHGEGLNELSESSRPLGRLVHAAAALADLFCQERPLGELHVVKDLCCADTKIEPAKLEQVLESLDQHVRDTASMLVVDLGQTVQYAQLQMDAATQLAQLSMQAEVDRAQSVRREEQARHEVDRLNEEKKAILEVAATDGLTKVANRPAFDKRLDEEIKRAQDAGYTLGLIMLDVDDFKKFNDAHGHQAGDEVLRSVAACLRETVRHDGFVARYGGEEFAVIVAEQASEQVRGLAEQIRRAIESRTTSHAGRALRVTASLGATVATPRAQRVTPKQLIAQADKCLYEAKHGGRNRVQISG